MNDPGVLSSLEQRIAALESSYRRTRFAAVVFGAIAAITILTAQTSSSPTVFGDPQGAHTTIGPDGVRVFDAQGKRRLDMQIGPNGIAGYGVTTAAGKYVAEMNGGSPGGFVSTSTNNGTDATFMGVNRDGGSEVSATDSKGTRRAYLGVVANGSISTLQLWDAAGKLRSYLGLATGGLAELKLFDKSETERAFLGETSDGNGSALSIEDSRGTRRAYFGIYADGSSGMSAHNSSGTATFSTPSAR